MALPLGSLTRLSTVRRPLPTPTAVPVFAISNIEKEHGVTRKELGVFDVCAGQSEKSNQNSGPKFEIVKIKICAANFYFYGV